MNFTHRLIFVCLNGAVTSNSECKSSVFDHIWKLMTGSTHITAERFKTSIHKMNAETLNIAYLDAQCKTRKTFSFHTPSFYREIEVRSKRDEMKTRSCVHKIAQFLFKLNSWDNSEPINWIPVRDLYDKSGWCTHSLTKIVSCIQIRWASCTPDDEA